MKREQGILLGVALAILGIVMLVKFLPNNGSLQERQFHGVIIIWGFILLGLGGIIAYYNITKK